MSRIFTTSFASVNPHYLTKVEKKGSTKADLDRVIGMAHQLRRVRVE